MSQTVEPGSYVPSHLNTKELLRWYGEGKLRPLVTDRLPLERAAEAIRRLTDRKAHGKIVIVPDGR